MGDAFCCCQLLSRGVSSAPRHCLARCAILLPAASVDVRTAVGRRLLAVATLLEDEFGSAQVRGGGGGREECVPVCVSL